LGEGEVQLPPQIMDPNIVRLMKAWEQKALEIERQAEHETGLTKDRLLTIAQVLHGCQEDLRERLLDEFLELGDLFSEGAKPTSESPQTQPKEVRYDT
jgi:hypothetical protein